MRRMLNVIDVKGDEFDVKNRDKAQKKNLFSPSRERWEGAPTSLKEIVLLNNF